MPTNTLSQSALLQSQGFGGWKVLTEQPSTEMVTVPAAAPGLVATQAPKYPAGAMEWIITDGKGQSRTMTVTSTTGPSVGPSPGTQSPVYTVVSPPADVKAPTGDPIISGVVTPADQWIVKSVNGVPTPSKNPIWDGTTAKPQTVTLGNSVYKINPDGSTSAIATDSAAETRANAAQANQDTSAAATSLNAQSTAANARTAAASQAATAWAAQAANDLAVRVSNGEDAASIRAEQTEKAAELHQAWVEADGDAKRVQAQLDAANAETHATAKDTQAASDAAATAAANAAQQATTQRGQDTVADSNRYNTDASTAATKVTTDTAARTARLNAGNTLLQNSLASLQSINAALPPGSDLAGKALEGMLRYGEAFLRGISKDDPEQPQAAAIADSIPKPTDTPAPLPVNPVTPDWTRADAGQTTPDPGTGLAAPGAAGTVPVGSPTYLGLPSLNGSVATPVFNPSAAGSSLTGGESTGMPRTYQPSANDATTAGLVAQNAASHATAMAAPVSLAPDGSPLATPADIARVWGKTANTVAQGVVAGQPMASGGIVTQPTMALIGEAGPEAVVPLGGQPNWDSEVPLGENNTQRPTWTFPQGEPGIIRPLANPAELGHWSPGSPNYVPPSGVAFQFESPAGRKR